MSKNVTQNKFWSTKRIFYVPKLTPKTVCSLGLLIAITVVLSMISGHLRIGNISKLTVSFISVFIAAYSFGGITGGLVGALADMISCFVNPVGPLMIQITLIEFVFGFIYGLFFYKISFKLYVPAVLVCDLIQFITNIFLKTMVLAVSLKIDFNALFVSRLPMCIIQMVIIFAVITLIKPFLKTVDKAME